MGTARVDPAIRQTFYTTDGLGNVTYEEGDESVFLNAGGIPATAKTFRSFDPVSGRLILSSEGLNKDTTTTSGGSQTYITRYDLSGNVTWHARYLFDQSHTQSEQRSYYAADNTLRATDDRYWVSGGGERATFEEYVYDALGRRVGVRTRQFCSGMTEMGEPRIDCAVSTIRRTFWDGDAELGEIQMPGEDGVDLERDSIPLRDPAPALNLEPFFGRVAYVYAGTLDQPLAVSRMGYQTLVNTGAGVHSVAVPAFTFYPLWNSHGVADRVSPLGSGTACDMVTNADYPGAGGTDPGAIPVRTCVRYDLADNIWLPFHRATAPNGGWQGSLLEDKRDGSGLMYRRNRYYDPTSGRFTQEDPIGLAGGLNLYGYANGDPVNFSDPFGLFACKDANGKEIDCPEPAGGPPVRLPDGKNGKPNGWVPIPGSEGGSRGTKYKPRYPVPSPDGGQPGASWDPDGHWDVDDGLGGDREHYAPDGTKIDGNGNPVAMCSSAGCRNAAGAAAALGTGYLLYRGARLLPSLFPPLWPTIPANLAIP